MSLAGGPLSLPLILAGGPLSLAELAQALTASGRDAVRKAQDIIARPPPALRDLPAAGLVRLRGILEQLTCP